MQTKQEIDNCLAIIQSIENSFQNIKEETNLPFSFFEENNRRIYELKKAINQLEELQFELKIQERNRFEEEWKNSQETVPEVCRIQEEIIIEPTIVSSEKEKSSVEFLADKIGKKIFPDIQSSLSLNDRFRFQRDLFRNNSGLMQQSLNHLNELESFDETINYLNSQFSWNWEDESVVAFKDILKTKFS